MDYLLVVLQYHLRKYMNLYPSTLIQIMMRCFDTSSPQSATVALEFRRTMFELLLWILTLYYEEEER